MMNNSLEEIGRVILENNSIIIFPHLNMDGDTLGSSVALCKALRSIGKECHILIEDSIPDNLSFLDDGYCTYEKDIIVEPQVCICVDCGDISRFEKRKDKFAEGKVTICIDHHRTTNPFCKFNYIVPEAAATGQLIYKLLQTMNIKIDKCIGEAIFAAITTDTGNFQYSNTTKETHQIVAELYDAGINSNAVSVEIYENVPMEKLMIRNKAINTMVTVAEGKGAIGYVTQKMLAETGATMDQTEGVVDEIRSISGVEIAAVLKETSEKNIKVSLRAKTQGDVSEIAERHNGGGHEKAAGFTLLCTLTEAFDIVKEEIMDNLKNGN